MADDIPRMIEEGELTIAGIRLRSYVLSNGMRVIHADDVDTWVEALLGGTPFTTDDGEKLGRFVAGVSGPIKRTKPDG